MKDDIRVLDVAGLGSLVDTLRSQGYTVIAPTVRDGAIVNAPITSIDQLPRGWGDEQDAGTYRLRERHDDAFFAFAAGAQSMKPVFFPADELLWKGRRDQEAFTVDNREVEPGDKVALLGVRGCDLRAIEIHDAVLRDRAFQDAHYTARRANTLVIAIACSDPAGTCFCASMGTGPKPAAGYDLSLTEVIDGDSHTFVVEVGSERGADLAHTLVAPAASAADLDAADAVVANARANMGRELDTEGLKYLLYANAESPRWDDIASRCLACTNCTLVCPTCFCTTVADVSDLAGVETERHRVWDSCFSEEFSYIHGGPVRESTRSRYRQWMTHKLAAWEDQFGMSGCVGCGRCITWCPAGIDITAEAAALRGGPPANRNLNQEVNS